MIAPLLVALALAGPVEEGAAAWEQGDMDGAIAAWEGALDEGRGSVTLHTNLGVAWYRKGDLPRAIAHWRMARILGPRDPDPAHDIAVARAELEGPPRPANPVPAWLVIATVGEYGVLGTVLLLLASVGAWVGRLRRWPVWPWLVVGLLGAVFGVASVEGARRLRDQPVAVVLDEGVGLRADPDATAPAARRLPPGTELAVQRRRPDFLLVATGDGERGWVPSAAVAVVGTHFEPPATAGARPRAAEPTGD